MINAKTQKYRILLGISMLLITGILFAGDIHTIAGGGSPEQMAAILEVTEDSNIRDADGWTALHHAARYNTTEVTKLLLDANADVNAASPEGVTPIMLAMLNPARRKEAINLIEMFIEYGADINAQDSQGWTPLLYAARYNPSEPAMISELIQAGVDVNYKTEKGLLPLFYEARFSEASSGAVQLFRSKYSDADYTTDVTSPDGKAAIMYAAANTSPRITALQFLLYSGNMGFGGQTDENGNTPLMIALANNGIPRAVQYLLEVTPRIRKYRPEYHPHKPNDAGWTALMIAARHNANPENIELLLNPPPKAQITNAKVNDSLPENGWTPLMLATRYAEDPKTIELLIDAGAEVNAQSNEGLTALMTATANPNPEILELLLEHGANPTVVDNYGWSALTYATKRNTAEGNVEKLTEYMDN
jgi:ankyrin repeat protein